MTSSRAQALSTILQDLDRCEHGRHRGDVCSGYSPSKPYGGCNGGISLGNPYLTPGRPIGYNLSGEPYVFPVEPFTTGEPKAWMPDPGSALDVYLEMRHQVEPVLQLPTEENMADDSEDAEGIQKIIDVYGWAVLSSPVEQGPHYTITVGMSARGLPELVLYDMNDNQTSVALVNAVACAHAQTVNGLEEGCTIRVGPMLVSVVGSDPVFGHRWHPMLGRLYGEDVPVIGVIA